MMSNSRGLDTGCLKKVVFSLSKYTVVYSLLGRVPTVCFLSMTLLDTSVDWRLRATTCV